MSSGTDGDDSPPPTHGKPMPGGVEAASHGAEAVEVALVPVSVLNPRDKHSKV